MADEATAFKVAGVRYEISPNDFTAAEAGDFRRELGFSLGEAFSAGSADLDVIAGLVWLIRRRTVKGLGYRQVAESITYADIEADDGTEVVGDELDPEASGGRSER